MGKGIAVGLIIGLLIGVAGGSVLGRHLQKSKFKEYLVMEGVKRSLGEPSDLDVLDLPMAPGVKPRPTATRPAPAPSVPLKLKERGWRQKTPSYCSGTFEVESAPPSAQAVDLFVMDASGMVLGSGMEFIKGGLYPGTLLEFNLSGVTCSKVKKWRAQIK